MREKAPFFKGDVMKTTNKNEHSLFVENTKAFADLVASILVLIIGMVFLIEAQKLPDKVQGIGPGDYPTVICIILLVLGTVLLIQTLVRTKGIPIIESHSINIVYLSRFAIMVACSFLFYLLLKPVGFLITAPLYLYFCMIFFGYKRKIKGAIISVLFTTIVYFLFRNVFLVMLPAGLLG